MKEGITISEPPSILKVFPSCYWGKEVLDFFTKKFCMNHVSTRTCFSSQVQSSFYRMALHSFPEGDSSTHFGTYL